MAAPKVGISDICAWLEVLKNGVATVLVRSFLHKLNEYQCVQCTSFKLYPSTSTYTSVHGSTSRVQDPSILWFCHNHSAGILRVVCGFERMFCTTIGCDIWIHLIPWADAETYNRSPAKVVTRQVRRWWSRQGRLEIGARRVVQYKQVVKTWWGAVRSNAPVLPEKSTCHHQWPMRTSCF